MLPSKNELKEYFFAHPIAGTFIAFAAAEAIKTLYESIINPKGQSPFSTYTDIRSGDILDDLGNLTSKQAEELDAITGELRAASKMHAEQSKQLKAASKKHAGQADRISQLGMTRIEKFDAVEVPTPGEHLTSTDQQKTWYQGKYDNLYRHHAVDHYNTHKGDMFFGGLGSTSTTTSTSSAHGGNARTPTGSTWDKLKSPGERPQMFGGPKKGSVLMGPPSMRRRISLNSITLGGHAHAPQKLNQEPEQLGMTSHFGMMNMMPEQSADATDNPLV